MGRQYARGERAWGICGRSGRKMLLRDMVFDGRYPNMRVDPAWYEARHPLEMLPMVDDPVALYRPSPEVNDAPTAPVLTLESINPTQINVTWTPAESGITDIASYLVFRSVDGGAYQQIARCDLTRDFLGGITAITNATFPQYPEHPGDPWTTVPADQPATYVDTNVTVGTEYCYYVEALPLGNNQAVAQGPPVNSATVCTNFALAAPILLGSYDFTSSAADLSWSMPGQWAPFVQHYQVYRSAAGGAFALLATITGTTYTDVSATDYRDGYQYYIVALYAAGNSGNSNTASVPNAVTTTYTVSTTWLNPAGAKAVRVRAVGGGQGGGPGRIGVTPPFWGYGGCGGSYVDATFLASALPASVPITIGAAGIGSTDILAAFDSGGDGGDTLLGPSVPYYVQAYGGQNNASNSIANGAQSYTIEKGGDQAGTPNTTYAGAAGGGGVGNATTNLAPGTVAQGPGGPGGVGAPSGSTLAQNSGSPGFNYGGGGGGGAHSSGGAGYGANGAPGVILITVYS